MTSPRPRRSARTALRRRRSLRVGLVQLLYICVAIAAGLVVPTLDVGARMPTSEAVSLTAGVTAGLLALAGIVFGLLFLVVEFAATTQSPRLNLFRDNPLVWHTLALIVGVLVYGTTCALVASAVDTTTVLVPISVLVAVVVALGVARRLQLDAFRSLQLASVLDEVTHRSRAILDGLYPDPFPGSTPPEVGAPERVVEIRWRGTARTLRQVDVPPLIALAQRSDAVIRLRTMPGELVRENAVVLEVWDPVGVPDGAALLGCLEVGIERNLTQDPLLGFRLLNDIALRALSTAINDPATAAQALDSIESLLLAVVGRDLAIGVVIDDAGRPRVLLNPPDWETFLAAGTDEIACLPVHPLVRRRLRELLEQILLVAPAERRAPVERRLAAIGGAVGGVVIDGSDDRQSP